MAATASNNVITFRRQEEKIFDSLKRSNKASHVDDEKLSQRQKRAIQLNRVLLLMYGKKVNRRDMTRCRGGDWTCSPGEVCLLCAERQEPRAG